MKIKIIDLLIKIAKEEAPKKIRYQSKIWNYCKDTQDYTDGTSYLIADGVDYVYKPKFLNDEIVIIEEEKEIEKIDITKAYLSSNFHENVLEDIATLQTKVNELIDEINKLKKAG